MGRGSIIWDGNGMRGRMLDLFESLVGVWTDGEGKACDEMMAHGMHQLLLIAGRHVGMLSVSRSLDRYSITLSDSE